MNGIVWLVSYPRSGNTWMRILLANLSSTTDGPVDINRLTGDGIASGRELFDNLAGTEASELDEQAIERLRPRVYERLAERLTESNELLFMKVHDAWTADATGGPLFPESAGRRVVYIVRNPLDVAVSMAHFNARPLDRVIRMMASRQAVLGRRADRLHIQLRQKLLTWSGHVESWVDRSGLDVEVVRYEDMHSEPVETLSRGAAFIGLETGRPQLERAVANSSFSELRRQEQAHGFRERGKGPTFFRQGRVGSWRQELTPDQIDEMIGVHRTVMTRFGYLTAAGLPVE